MKSMNRPVFSACKVLGLGAELRFSEDAGYTLSEETARRTDEMGKFYHAYSGEVSMVCSGYYPALANPDIPRPPVNIHEAGMMCDRLVTIWGVPLEKIAAEGTSLHTFDNFARSIEQGYLLPGEFGPDHPLILSVSRSHSWRAGLIACHALQLPMDNLFCLELGDLDTSQPVRKKERELAMLTQLAIEAVEMPPGDAQYVDELGIAFAAMWDDRHALLDEFKKENGAFWLPEEAPMLAYI